MLPIELITVPTGTNFDFGAASTSVDGYRIPQPSGGASAVISTYRSDLRVAPEGINFDVSTTGFDTPGPLEVADIEIDGDYALPFNRVSDRDVYDPQFHDLYYYWSFGDAGTVYSAPQKVAAAMMDANRMFGPLASHTYQNPGTYLVQCLILEPSSGKWAIATQNVTVGDKEVLFAGARTIFCSTDLSYSRKPDPAMLEESDPFAALDLQRVLQEANPDHFYRIMFDREVDHFFHKTGNLRISKQTNLWFEYSPGVSDPGTIFYANEDASHAFIDDQLTTDRPGENCDVVFNGLKLDGYFDVQTESMGGPYAAAHPGSQVFYNQRNPEGSTYMLFNRLKFTGGNKIADISSNHQNGPEARIVVFNDIECDSWSDFAIFENEQGFSAYTGCRLRQDPLALSGGVKGIGHNNHGPVRIQQGGKCAMHSCDFFVTNGWFRNTPFIHTTQPCVRWNMAGDQRAKLNMQGCVLEGGNEVVSIGIQDSNYIPVLQNALIDKCVIIGNSMTSDLIKCEHSGLTVRNTSGHQTTDRTARGFFEPASFVRFVSRSQVPSYVSARNEVYNCTFDNALSDAQSVDGDARLPILRTSNATTGSNIGDPFTGVAEVNNVINQPNLGAPDVAFAPLGDTVLLTPRELGYRHRRAISDTGLTLASDVPDGGTVTIPYADYDQAGLTAGDFDQANPDPRKVHGVRVGGALHFSNGVSPGITVSFGVSDVTFTNTSGTTWAAGLSFVSQLATLATYEYPTSATPLDAVKLRTPQVGSSAIDAATAGLRSIEAFDGTLLTSQTNPAYTTRNAGAH